MPYVVDKPQTKQIPHIQLPYVELLEIGCWFPASSRPLPYQPPHISTVHRVCSRGALVESNQSITHVTHIQYLNHDNPVDPASTQPDAKSTSAIAIRPLQGSIAQSHNPPDKQTYPPPFYRPLIMKSFPRPGKEVLLRRQIGAV